MVKVDSERQIIEKFFVGISLTLVILKKKNLFFWEPCVRRGSVYKNFIIVVYNMPPTAVW